MCMRLRRKLLFESFAVELLALGRAHIAVLMRRPMIEIRPARTTDAEAIASLSAEVQAQHTHALPQLFKPAGLNTFPPAAVRQLLDEPGRLIFVGCVNGTVVAYASAQIQQRSETPFRYAGTALYIQWIGVRAASRRQGVGRALINILRDAAVTHGIPSVLLDVWAFNTEALTFYKAMGFHPQRHILALELDPTASAPHAARSNER